MIRDRLDQDVMPLCAVLAELSWPPGAASDADRRAWLQEVQAEQSWVFDAAPVSVAPTGNVTAHVQVFAPGEREAALVRSTGAAGEELLVIGRLFVRPGSGAEGIRRFLLRESVRFCRSRGRTPVLDLAANPGLSETLCQKQGFAALGTTDTVAVPMVHGERGGGR